MKLNATEEISAPIDHVFAQLCDADRLERMVRKRGGKIARSPEGPIACGTEWTAEVAFRGKKRKLGFNLTEMDGPQRLRFLGGSDGLDLNVAVDLEEVGPHTTRLLVTSEAKPKTLAARLLMQSAKLARGVMLTRYRKRIGDFAAEIEKTTERLRLCRAWDRRGRRPIS